MKASRTRRDVLICSAFGTLIAFLESCSGAAPSDLLTPHPSGSQGGGAGGSSGAGEGGAGDSAAGGPQFDGASGSGGGTGPCNAQTCANGCCDTNGRCASGDTDGFCGGGGGVCQDCTQQAATCSGAQTCSPMGSSGSSSGSSSGAGCVASTCPTCPLGIGIPCCTMTGTCGCGGGAVCF